MKKGKILQYLLVAFVVIILLCGIFSIIKRLTGTSSTDTLTKKEKNSKGSEVSKEEKADNSKPMTSLTITAPQGYLRVGETMQLEIKYEPADATNTKLKWSCSEEDMVSVSEDGVLTPDEDSGKNTVTVTAKSTDGSKLKQSFELRILPEIDPSKPMVAITFDDGPNPDTTNTMLDALEENYAKATFFCLGSQTESNPEVVKREYELGMEVGTHTYAHKNIAAASEAVIEEEISKGVGAIKDAIGTEPVLMRTPYGGYGSDGKIEPRVLAAAKNHNLCCVNWSLDTEDWRTKNADATYQMVMKATDGDVVLLHDIHEYNVAAVQRFVPDLIDQGFQLVTVSELYAARGESLDPGTIHFRTDPTTEVSSETGPAEATDGQQPDAATSTEDMTTSTQEDSTGGLDFSQQQTTSDEDFGND